jgi:hypothetical protein
VPEFRRFELYERTREITDREDEVKLMLTLLGDKFNQGDKSDIRRRSHGMVQQDSTESAAVLVTGDDGASCTQAHPIGRC